MSAADSDIREAPRSTAAQLLRSVRRVSSEPLGADTEIDEITTVFVVALPTPSAPPLALMPL